MDNSSKDSANQSDNASISEEASANGSSNSNENRIRNRIYRARMLEESDEENDENQNLQIAQQHPAADNPAEINEHNSDQEQVSDENEENSNSSDSDSDDFSFDSPLSPLLRFGLGGRRMFGNSDSDSEDSYEDTEELREKVNQATIEIMSKDAPPHTFSWPNILLNRERGFFCKQNEMRYLNHRKVFERSFYGSLNAVQRLELMVKLSEHFGCVNCLGFSKNGLHLLSGSDDLRVILWNWYNNKAITMAISKHKKNIFQTKFFDESEAVLKAVSASADGTVSIHQFTNDGGHTEKQVYTHHGPVHKLAITDSVIYTCGEDGLIIEFDYRTKTPTKLLTVREKHRKIPLFSITAHPNECKYAVSGRDQFVRVYDRRNEKTVLSRHCPMELLERNTTIRYISCCVYNYNGTELLASFNDENIYLFDSSNTTLGSYKNKFQGHVNSATIKGVNFFGPNSEYIVTGSDCSHLFFYEKQSAAIVQYMRADENGICNVLEPHPFYPVLATSGLDKDVKIWMPSNGEFELNKDNLEKCVKENMRNQFESAQNPSFSLDPAIIELARRFFQRQRSPVAQQDSTTDSE